MGVANTAFIGHLGTQNEIAGAGMAIMTLQIMCFAIMQGFNNALNTLVSQADGTGEYHLCGTYLNRVRVITTIFFIIISIICQFAGRLFRVVGLDDISA